MPLTRPSRAVSANLIRQKCDDFADFHVWPLRSRLDPRGWLSNFAEDDQPYAYHLLNAFMYFSEDLTLQLFLSAMQNISVSDEWRRRNPGDPFSAWPRFLRRVQLTYVTGETPSPADSGHVFVRKARDHAGIGEEKIADPGIVLAKRAGGDRSPVIFVDDFVGSGTQFCETWQRIYDNNGHYMSFQAAALEAKEQNLEFEVYYAPAVCTVRGLEKIRRSCPGVIVTPGNILDDRYSVFHEESLVWPQDLCTEGRQMIERVSEKLGIAADKSEWDYRGFDQLGLALGFAHKTPDATIPLFRWSKDGWHPLVKEV